MTDALPLATRGAAALATILLPLVVPQVASGGLLSATPSAALSAMQARAQPAQGSGSGAVVQEQPRFVDATVALGLGPEIIPGVVARLCFADLDDDGFADLIVDRHRVFMNRSATSTDGVAGPCRRFVELAAESTGLRAPLPGTVAVFVDLDGDAVLDAVTAENCDVGNPKWSDHGRLTRWQRGRGDGTFGAPLPLPVPRRTTIAIAIGDVNRDGRLDLWFANAYVRYGESVEAWPNDLLLSASPGDDGLPRWNRAAMPEDSATFDEELDAAGRPAYGAMMLSLSELPGPALLELGYGRRANRLWVHAHDAAAPRTGELAWQDHAPALGIDGDSIRHGRYPEWLRERAKTDPRFDRRDEKPFRSNGNTFDASVGDVDNDGRFDLLLTEITHAWAGASSDRSRILFDRGPATVGGDAMPPRFTPTASFSIDRVPPPGEPDEQRWNQGDLFGALADLDNDGWIDLIISSGDYPDDERLRVWRNRGEGLEEVTKPWGIDHDGSQQISLADLDGDGDLDLAAGQTFNRYGAPEIRGRSPHPTIWLNQAASVRRALELRLRGDGVKVNRHAIGAVVEVTMPDGAKRIAQLVGPGGHAGKQHDAVVHIGLGDADQAKEIVIRWPGAVEPTRLGPLPAGRWRIGMDGVARAEGGQRSGR